VTVILLPFFYSCEKELVYEDYQSSTLLRQVRGTEGDMEVMTYYNTGNIFEHVQRFSYRKFLYNKKGQLIKIEIALSLNPLSCAIIPGTDFEAGDDPRKAKIGQYITYDYTDNGNIKIKKSYYINDEHEQLMNYSKYEYINDKVIKINIFNPKDQLTHYYTYLYDGSGNVSEEEYFYMQEGTDARLQTRILYEYDDKNNPYKVFSVEGTPGTYTNLNNIIKQTTIYYYTEGEQTDIIENTYEYNDSGYPVKVNDLEYIYGAEE
jgi:hypothetical protein